jgi:hypothetical protein
VQSTAILVTPPLQTQVCLATLLLLRQMFTQTTRSSHSTAEAQRIQRPTLAAYSLTSQARNSNEVWPQLSTELQTKPLPAQNALLAMSHRPQEVKALCSNAAISLPPCIHLSCRHHFPVTRQAVELPAVTQQHLSLPLTDVSNTASRYCSQETYMRLLPTMTQCIQNRRLAQIS